MAEYLDYTGLTYFKNKLDQAYNSKYVPQGVTINGVALNSSNITINAVDSTARIPTSQKGVANGVATLDANAKIPSSQLPSYVDDVKEYADLSSFPATGEEDKIYVAKDTGSIYRWSGSQYIQINSSVSNAESAIKDGNGNTITSTYATKTELSTAVPASIGSATKPVYTNSSGVITACTYELNKTVPSNAVFTDTKVTNTKGNTTKFYLTGTNSESTNTGTQYFDSTIYTTTTEGELVAKNFTGLASKATADASGNTITTTYATKTELGTAVPASVGSATKPVYTDSNGVITSCTYELNKSVPANAVFTDTDTKVTNTLGTTTKFYVTGTTSATTNTGGQTFDTGVYVSTTAGELVATKFTGALNGNANTASKINTSAKIGDTNKPVYIAADGTVTPISYTIAKSVPSDALFTDHTYSDFVKSGSTAAAGLVPKPSTTAGTTKFLCEDATWKVPYTHPTTAGNKHIPSGGFTGQVLIYGGSSGTASWSDVSSAITSITTTQIDALFT